MTEGEQPIVSVKQLGLKGTINPTDLDIYPGQVVGFAGLLGSGRTELGRLLYGADKPDSGTYELKGKKTSISDPYTALRNKIAYSTENRRDEGIIGDLTVRENILIALQATRGMFKPIPKKEADEIVDKYMKELNVRPNDPNKLIKNLSGGNQQKVLIARWLATHPDLLILDEPTRGIDIGAKAEIQQVVLDLAAQGMGVVFISSEMEEVVRLSDDIEVLKDRHKIAELVNDNTVSRNHRPNHREHERQYRKGGMMSDKKTKQDGDSLVKKLLSSNLTWSVVALIVLIVICTISDHQFLSLSWNKNTGGLSGPLITMLQESARYLMIATGMTLVISTAGIDLSVGSVMAVAGAAAMQMLTSGVNVWLAIFLALLIGLGVGCINGALVSILGLQPFITTLIMMLAGRGLAKVITSGQNTDASSVAGGAPLKWMANGFILGIPANFVIALVIVALIGLLCRKTAMGMMVESVGINPEASRMTGIKPKKILFLVYAISGLLAAVAGLFATASVMRVDVVKTGQDLEMYAILAVVIGGTSLLGGKFSLAGSALGAVIIAMIRKTIITLGIDSAATPAFFAVVVIVICVMQAPKIHNLGAEIKRKCALKTQTKAVAA